MPDTRRLSAQTPEQAATLIESVARNYAPGGSAHYALFMGAAALRQTKTCDGCGHFLPWDRLTARPNGSRGDCTRIGLRGKLNGMHPNFGCVHFYPLAPPVAEGETR